MSLENTQSLKIMINSTEVGVLSISSNFSRFNFFDSYKNLSDRPVLGQFFEAVLDKEFTRNMRLPQWFSNLLPEGKLRNWIELDLGRATGSTLEFDLLKRVGSNLPGAITAIPMEEAAIWHGSIKNEYSPDKNNEDELFRFSLAGVAMKFSSLEVGDRFVGPVKNTSSDTQSEWIVKVPEPRIPGLCLNEFLTMELARVCGLNVPKVKLVERDKIDFDLGVFDREINEPYYAIERFDRVSGVKVHIEDFCQFYGKYPEDKYNSSFESIVNGIVDRSSQPEEDYLEAIQRILFNILIDNGDAHLKNWSFIYNDPSAGKLSPLYDVASTGMHLQSMSGMAHDLGLKLNKNKRFENVSVSDFERIERKLIKPNHGYIIDKLGGINSIVNSFTENVNDNLSKFLKDNSHNREWNTYVSSVVEERTKLLLK